ncbi:MAG: glycosyltransferase family 39 protein [Nanoarchaeota archaeon]|nr:glycosyltransferase family 39 protein [Nanoarchaeota archaeon]
MRRLEYYLKRYGLLVSAIVLFLIIKLSQLDFKFSDGPTYMYMANLVLQGLVPYRDFFLANPPLQVYIIAFWELFFGNNILLLKLIPLFATVGSALFIYRFMNKKFGELQALTASVLFLFSFLILLTTDYSTGIHLTLFFILASFCFIEEDKPLLAGILGSLALLTRLYAVFPLAGAGLYYLIFKRAGIPKFIAGLLLVFLPISIILQTISNGTYLDQIFFFRLNLVSGIGLSKFSVVSFFLSREFVLILGTALYFIFADEKRKMHIPILATAFSLILYITYSDVYYLYFGLIMGFLAMFTTKTIFLFEDCKHFKKILALFLICFIIINSFFYIRNYASVSNITFSEDISNFVKENSFENQTIYGNFEIAPLVSLLSERKMADDIADTNPKNVMTGTLNMEEIEERIAGVKFIILKGDVLPDGSISVSDASTPVNYINENCILAKTYLIEKDYSNNAVFVFDCLD